MIPNRFYINRFIQRNEHILLNLTTKISLFVWLRNTKNKQNKKWVIQRRGVLKLFKEIIVKIFNSYKYLNPQIEED